MQLDDFEDVHPDWDSIATLTTDESRAARQLLLASLLIEPTLSAPAARIIAEVTSRFPGGAVLSESDVIQQAGRLRRSAAWETWQEFLDDVASRVPDLDARIALVRLLSIVLAVDGATEREQEFCYAVGDAFDVNYETVENLLRSAWETHEHLVTEERTGKKHHTPPLRGAGWARGRGAQGWGFPLVPTET
jgi:hypothetical protein